MIEIRTKRAYDKPANSDGPRLLVDRLWPRGVKKEDARLSEWLKNVAPSENLRSWYAHDENKWERFLQRYHAELKTNETDDLKKLEEYIRHQKRITLVYAAKNEKHNNAIALRDYLNRSRESLIDRP